MHTRELPLSVAPWALFRVLARNERPFFIDAGRPSGAEWISSMGFRPRMQFEVCAADAVTRGALASLDAAVAAVAPSHADRARPRPLPFAGGAVVALAYETKSEVERLPASGGERADAPRIAVAIYDAVVAYDHHRGRYAVASWHLDAPALARFAEEVMDAAADHERTVDTHADGGAPEPAPVALTTTLERDAYVARVERIRAYIDAGDVYQVNLGMHLEAALAESSLATYGRLRAVQPVPFGAYVDLGTRQILSNSPELFLRRRGERVETCPIKGTRRRGIDAADDARLVDELRRDAKERAEHVMIVDLERSDLGRVCRTGSVRVERFADVASFRTLHHIVSSVSGSLPREVPTSDLLRATFPGGSITGAPKIRAMEIIDEVEGGPRGFYSGAIGWIDASGDLDLNVAIRTAVAANGRVSYGVGGGIVADSTPDREHAECGLKAAAFVRALGTAAITDAGDAPDDAAASSSAQRRAS